MQTPIETSTPNTLSATRRHTRSSTGAKSVATLQPLLDALDPNNETPELADIYYRLGVSLKVQGQYADAITRLTQARTIYLGLGAHNKETALVLNQLAAIYLAQDKLDYAESYLKQALELLDPTQVTLALAETQHYLGLLRKAQKKYKEAALVLTQASNLYEMLGNNDNALVIVKTQLGMVHALQNEYMPAQQAFSHVLAILGEETDTSEVAEIMQQKGQLFLAQNELTQAANYFNKALTHYRAHNESGAHTLNIGMSLTQLGRVQQQQQKTAFAISSFQQALEAYTSVSSEPGLEVATIHQCLGELYLTNQQLGLAEASLSRALQIYQACHADAPDHQDITRTQALLDKTKPGKPAPIVNQPASQNSRSWCCFRFSGVNSARREQAQTTMNPLVAQKTIK